MPNDLYARCWGNHYECECKLSTDEVVITHYTALTARLAEAERLLKPIADGLYSGEYQGYHEIHIEHFQKIAAFLADK